MTDTSITAFAPATVANLGPGFDVLGLALDAPGDRVTARFAPGHGVTIASIEGDDGRLPREPDRNTAGIAAAATLKRAGVDAGVALDIVKGLPVGSGLGSSAASAAAAAYAVNLLVGSPLRKLELAEPCLEAEAAVSGRHADNVAAALLGGLVLVRSVEPLDVVRLPVPEGLSVVVVTPAMELATRAAREALPREVPLGALVRATADIAAFVAACHSGDLGALSRAMRDDLITAARAHLIPGCAAVRDAALDAGAIGSAISGAGPSMFALARSRESAGFVARAMTAAFAQAGLNAVTTISPADCPGVRRI